VYIAPLLGSSETASVFIVPKQCCVCYTYIYFFSLQLLSVIASQKLFLVGNLKERDYFEDLGLVGILI
jgi:hypothetical protein